MPVNPAKPEEALQKWNPPSEVRWSRRPGPMFAGVIGVGAESLEVGFYREADIPWDTLAFPTVKQTLRRYYADLQDGQRRTHVFEIAQPRPS